MAMFPDAKPHDTHHYGYRTDSIAYGGRQTKPFGSHADIGDTDTGHEQGRDERDPIGFLLLYQVYGDSPEGEDREGLVAPRKVAPDNFEAIGIGQAIDERRHSDQEQRDADNQAALDAALLHV